ncbi:MAG: helix-turn-helix transcriptional regulator [Candidatus Binataceae bacterium]
MGLSKVIRDRRRALDLTQEELASRIGVSTAYVGHLETARRQPSEPVLLKLVNVLGFDYRELFLLANPDAVEIVSSVAGEGHHSWDKFLNDRRLRKLHRISNRELEMLSRVAAMGDVRSPHDFLFVLNAIRNALAKEKEP